MKITLQKLVYLLAFVTFTLAAKAQDSAVPDTLRLSIGIDGSYPQSSFANSYTFGVGGSLQLDLPITTKLYATANAGYSVFSPNNNGSNPEAIVGVNLSAMSVAPVKIGLKYFLIRTFYLQAEGGETLLLNKSAVYGLNGNGLTYAGQMGILFKLNKNRRYIDGGIRYERQQSFYGDGHYNTFLGFRVAYAFNL
jgi:hypothetical protein